METQYSPDRITHASIQTLVESYADYLPADIEALEQARMIEIPDALASRDEGDQDAFLDRNEVSKLVQWKL
jgi:hypothetical protein